MKMLDRLGEAAVRAPGLREIRWAIVSAVTYAGAVVLVLHDHPRWAVAFIALGVLGC